MRAALRYRRAQALAVAVLAALVTMCLVLAPLYTRALEQAMVGMTLREAAAERAGVRLASTSATDRSLAVDPAGLTALLPASIRDDFGPPIAATAVDVRKMPLLGQPGGQLLARAGQCDHVRFTAGACPTEAFDVAISTDQATAYGLAVGQSIEVGEFDELVSLPESAPRTTLRVVGVYDQVDGPYWFGDRLTGQAAKNLGYDTMLTAPASFTASLALPGGGSGGWFQPRYAVDLPLLPERVSSDDLDGLGSTVARLTEFPMGVENAGSHVAATVTVRSGLPAIADEMAVGRSQAAITVPLLMAQLGLLLVAVLWLILVAASDQRRAEVAVARLRGRGSRGARRLLVAETLPPVVLGVPIGAVLAVGAVSATRHTVLAFGDWVPPFELPVWAYAAALAALAGMVGLVLLSVQRVCREPVASLIRSVPPRPVGIRLGVLEGMLVASAGAAFLALATGSVRGPVGLVAPTLLALAVGVIASRVLPSLLAFGGRRLLRSGRPASGAALLSASRRGTTRWLVPVVTVALCITVVTTDALAVGARNRDGRAAAEVGAASVFELDSVDLAEVVTAVRAVDPGGAHLTPVVAVTPSEAGRPTTLGVVPGEFRRIALWPGVDIDALPWDRLTASPVPPLVVQGTAVSYHVQATGFRPVGSLRQAAPTALAIGLRVVRGDGRVESMSLGLIPEGGVDADQTVPLDCADGCRIAGLGIIAPPSTAPVAGTLTLSKLAVGGAAVDLGGSGAWRDVSTSDSAASAVFRGDGVTISYSNGPSSTIFVNHGSVPGVVPALTTAAARPSAQGATFAGSFVDGSPLLMRSEGGVAFAPGGPTSTALVHLDNLLAQGWTGRGSASLTACLDSADPATVARVQQDLAAHGIAVLGVRHPEQLAQTYARSAAAWSLQLALAVGVLSLLVAGVGIIVLASTSWRARSRDYAGLRMAGATARGVGLVAHLETAPVVVASAVLGAVIGLWAAPPAIGMVPLFTTPPPTFPIDLTTAWGLCLLSGLAGLVVLTVVGAVMSRRVAARSELARLRETT